MHSLSKRFKPKTAGLMLGALALVGSPVLTHAEEASTPQPDITQSDEATNALLSQEEGSKDSQADDMPNANLEVVEVEKEIEQESEEVLDEKPIPVVTPEVKSTPAPAVVKPVATPEVKAEVKPEVRATQSTVIVQSGDTLGRIAARTNTTVDQLVQWNKLANRNLIFVGQKLIIHPTTQAPAQTPAPAPAVVQAPKAETPVASNIKISKAMTPQQFINTIAPVARKVAQDNGLYASVMIAQAALESGYGDSSLSLAPNHNLFGIKGSFNGQSVAMNTSEFVNGKWVRVVQNFKRYPSHQASFEDNARLLRRGLSWSPAFYSGTWIENARTYQDATSWLQGRYATDPTYANKLNRVIQSYNLTQYDTAGQQSSTKPETVSSLPVTKSTPSTNASTTQSTYIVKRGDTLGAIARQHNTTVARLKSANNLKSDLILIGQRLVVSQQASTPAPKPAVSTPSQSTTQTTKAVTYTVKRGDTLSKIARDHKTTVARLKSVNNLKSDLILIGQRLTVSTTTTTQTVAKAPTQSAPASSQTIKVQRGDTLSHLARRHNTTVQRLKQLNNLKSDLIFINQTLKVK